MDLYRKDIFQGGWFSFHSTVSDWVKTSKKLQTAFFKSFMFNEVFGESEVTDELLIKSDIDFSFIKDKSVLVIGGGPSSKTLTDNQIKSYDLVFSCNHFFKNDLLKKHKIHLALIGDEVNFNDPEFLDYVNNHNPILGFDHSARRPAFNLLKLKESYPLCFIWLTRYFSRLGYVPRACVLAKLFGASKIDFIGLDGFRTNEHFFEKDKNPPPFNDVKEFQDQMRVFCEYMLNCLKIEVENFNDLSSDNIYEGILEDVKLSYENGTMLQWANWSV
tara:strand:- start:166 stop:987 length:822 start_codon:yes stop_codon:yes gene_type:complete